MVTTQYPECVVCHSLIIDASNLPQNISTWRVVIQAPGHTEGATSIVCGSCAVILSKLNLALYPILKGASDGNEKRTGQV